MNMNEQVQYTDKMMVVNQAPRSRILKWLIIRWNAAPNLFLFLMI